MNNSITFNKKNYLALGLSRSENSLLNMDVTACIQEQYGGVTLAHYEVRSPFLPPYPHNGVNIIHSFFLIFCSSQQYRYYILLIAFMGVAAKTREFNLILNSNLIQNDKHCIVRDS